LPSVTNVATQFSAQIAPPCIIFLLYEIKQCGQLFCIGQPLSFKMNVTLLKCLACKWYKTVVKKCLQDMSNKSVLTFGIYR